MNENTTVNKKGFLNKKNIIFFIIIITILLVIVFACLNNYILKSNKSSSKSDSNQDIIENNDEEIENNDSNFEIDNDNDNEEVDEDNAVEGNNIDENNEDDTIANEESTEENNVTVEEKTDTPVNENNNTSTSHNNNNNNSNTNTNSNNNSNSSTNNNNSIIEVKNITLNYSSYELFPGSSITLNATLAPNNATNKAIIWESSNTNVATVNNGYVEALSAGTSIITAKTSNNKIATCTITVKNINKIHYISNGNSFVIPSDGSKGASPSNTIVLESNGHYALIDTGLNNNDSLNPGHVNIVINYLKRIGVNKLDFIIISHAHYDHIGGLTEILDNIQTDVVYIKPYYSHDSKGSGSLLNRTNYANLLKQFYSSSFSCDDSCLNDANKYRSAIAKVDSLYGTVSNNVGRLNMTSTLYKINAKAEGKKLYLGNMIITLYNATNLSYHSECYGTSTSEFDENSNSIITYIEMGNKKALLGADLEKISKTCYNKIYGTCSTNNCSIMSNIVNKIGNGQMLNVDLLELSHHGYSSCDMTLEARDKINPHSLVIPNWREKINYYYTSIYTSSHSCKDSYFNTSYYDSNSYYVGSKNTVFDFTNNQFNTYVN